MPQPSIPYACGRIGVLGRSALKRAQIERLMAAHTYQEAQRTLMDIGFLSSEDMDVQTAADLHVQKACKLVRELTPQPQVTDCFLLRYDVHNLKVLLKSRFLAQKPDFLSACGTIPIENLRHAVADHTYTTLPISLREAMEGLEKKLVIKFDPMLIDTELDKAMYKQAGLWLEGKQADVAKRYFSAKADLQNFIMLVRAKAMGKENAFFASIALPGGKVKAETFLKAIAEPDRLARLMMPYGNGVFQQAVACTVNAGKLPLLEKTADDYLYGLFKPYQYNMTTIATLIGYLLQSQREAMDVRLILAGKLNGFDGEAVAERVRELNG